MFAFGYVPSRLTAEEAAALAAAKPVATEEQVAPEITTETPDTPAEPVEAQAAPAEEGETETASSDDATPVETDATSDEKAPETVQTPAEPAFEADAAVWTRRGRGAGKPDNRRPAASGENAKNAENGDQPKRARSPKNAGPKGAGPKGKGPRPPKSSSGTKPRREADKPIDPNSPFAVLAQLKK